MKNQELKNLIKNLVIFEMKNILTEQEPPEEPEVPADDDVSTDDLSDLDTVLDDEGDVAAGDEGGLDLDAGEEGEEGDLEGGDEGDFGGDGGTGGDGGFGGGGFGGGGADFGGDDDFGEEDEEEAAAEDEFGADMPEELMPEDPVQEIVDGAIAMLDITGDDQEILNAVKASIQKYFENFDEATPVVYELYNTKSPILLQVARKLLQFLKGI